MESNSLTAAAILRVRISHQHKKDIPEWLFHEMLRQAGLEEERSPKSL